MPERVREAADACDIYINIQHPTPSDSNGLAEPRPANSADLLKKALGQPATAARAAGLPTMSRTSDSTAMPTSAGTLGETPGWSSRWPLPSTARSTCQLSPLREQAWGSPGFPRRPAAQLKMAKAVRWVRVSVNDRVQVPIPRVDHQMITGAGIDPASLSGPGSSRQPSPGW